MQVCARSHVCMPAHAHMVLGYKSSDFCPQKDLDRDKG